MTPQLSPSDRFCSNAILNLITPFTVSHRMNGESVLPLIRNGQDTAHVRLAFVPTQPPVVTSCTGIKRYQLDRDYFWKSGSRDIYIPLHSVISLITEEQLYQPAGSQQFGQCKDRNNDIFFGPKDEYHQWQLAVTYPFDPENPTIPVFNTPFGKLPNTARRLRDSHELTIVLLGDSISVGHNASGLCGVPPYQPSFCELFRQAICTRFASPANMVNLSVSGKDAQWGLQQVDDVISHKPDLVILGFGMNDASGDCDPKDYQNTIRQIVQAIQQQLPNVEFILISPMTANAQWIAARPSLYPLYNQVLSDLQKCGVALADVLSVWQAIVDLKCYWDLTGNGLNHPNDFGHLLYAQTLWSTLLLATALTRP
jgi:lysophospholipase L1-like esterase